MKRKASSWFAAPIYLIVLLLTAGFSAALDAQAPVEDDSLAELSRRIEELDQQGKYQEAIPLAEKLLALTKEARGLDDRETAARIGLLAALYESMGDYSKAEPLYKEALEIRRKVLGPNHPKTADSLTYLAELYFAMREYAKAEPLLQQALQVRQKILGKKHPETLTSLNHLAALYESMGDYVKAEPLYKEALEIRQKVLGRDHPHTATSLNYLALLYWDMGNYGKAEPLLKEALQIRQKVLGKEHPETVTSLNNLAELYQSMGEYAKAEPLFQEALQVAQKVYSTEHPVTATCLNNLAALYESMGDYAKAQPLLEEALQIRRKTLGREHPDTAASLNNLAHLYWSMGDYGKAEPPLKEALQIYQGLPRKEILNALNCLEGLGMLYEEKGDYAKAQPVLQQALQTRQKILGKEHPDTVISLNNLAHLYWSMGDYGKARPLLEEALQIRQKVLGKEHPDTATSLNGLAVLYADMGEYAKAEPLYQEALQIRQKILGNEHPDTAISLDNLALLEFDLNRIEEAKALAVRASKVQHNLLSKMFAWTSEQQRLAYMASLNLYSLFALLPGCEADLALALLRYKGMVLDSIVEDCLLAEAGQGGEDQKRVEQLNVDKRQLGQLLLQPAQKLSAATSQRIESLEEEVQKIEGDLAKHVAGLGQARRALSVRLEQVQQAIPNDGALIEYLRYFDYLGKRKWELRYGAVVLLSKGDPFWIPLNKANETEKLVGRYGVLVKRSPQEEELSANLQALYGALWAPIEEALPSEVKRIIISPDGQLNFISFATLLDKDKQFLAQRYSVQYVASGRDLLREVKPSTSREVVLFADPDFNLGSPTMLAKADNGSSDPGSRSIPGSEKRDIEDWSFESLTGTKREGEELTEKFASWSWTPVDFTKKEATKEALLKEVRSPYVLHLATHGFFAKKDPSAAQTDSQVVLNDQRSVTESKFFKNPMHRSGLALAGANTTIEAWKRGEVPPVENDGILTAEDVSTLDLQGTWLVTLSACDTGSGEARAGEGVMGLRRGFIQAGAQNLLMTLWPISDDVTVQMMGDFYDAAHKTGNAPEALAEVQREWLVKLRTDKGLAKTVNLVGPFIMSSQGKP